MAIPISPNTRFASAKTIKEPNLVLCIEGYPKCFGSGIIREIIKIGEPDLYVGDTWVIGGIRIREDQITAISIDGSSTSIKQQLDAEKARGSSVQSMSIELVDIDQQITALISPSVLIDDVMGKKATVYLAIDNASAQWPDDYEILFRGNIDEIKSLPASHIINIAHPEQKKKQTIWPRAETTLPFSISNSDTTIDLTSVDGFLVPVVGANGLIDPDFRTYIVIEDEAIEYTSIVGNQLLGCVRGQLGTQPISHLVEARVISFIRLTGDMVSIALKMMMSKEDYYLTDLKFANYNVHQAPSYIPNTIYFEGINAQSEYGYVLGDYVTITGSANPSTNDITYGEITSLGRTDFGSYIEIDGAGFVDEVGTSALISFRSKYDVWPLSMGMGGDEVDVIQHEQIQQTYLSNFLYDIYVKDTIEDARDFLDQEIYKPASAYTVPRKAKASMAILQSPIPSVNTKLLNETNIVNPSGLVMRRSTTKQFGNTIVYKFDEDPIVEDKFLRGKVLVSGDSLTRIKVGTKALVIVSKGLRTSAGADLLINSASERKLKRYEYGAEYFEGVKLTFGAGWDIEVADVVIFDGSKLNLADTAGGVRGRPAQLVEVQNKTLNYKTGDITVDLVATGYSGAGKYALVGAASKIKIGINDKSFVIEKGFRSIYGTAEYQKWSRYTRPAVVIRSPDGVTRYFQTIISLAASNTIVVRDSLGFTPQAGDIMELAKHDFIDTSGEIKLIYGHMAPLDGGTVDPYQMI